MSKIQFENHGCHINPSVFTFRFARDVWTFDPRFIHPAGVMRSDRRYAIGNEITEFWEQALEKFLLARKGLRQDAFVDIEHPHLVRNPIEVVRRIYNWLGHDLPYDVELRMCTFLESTSSSRYGRHSYTLAAFDMDLVNLSKRFAMSDNAGTKTNRHELR